MQYVLDVTLVVMIFEGNISDVINHVCGIITNLHHVRSIGFPQIPKRFLNDS